MEINFKDISQIIIPVAAFVGMGLGIYNFWTERSKRKVKVVVKPKSITRRYRNPETGAAGAITSINEFCTEPLDSYFAIEAVNLSTFPVTVDNVGFELIKDDRRMSIVQPIFMDEGKWPRRLEQRESVTVYCSLPILLKDPGTCIIKNAFAETSCDNFFRGKSEALKGLVRFANQLQQRRIT